LKIGVIVDGLAEFHALPKLLGRVEPINIGRVLRADLQPFSEPGRIVANAKSRLKALADLGAERAIVLLDHETRSECPGDWAGEIAARLSPVALAAGLQGASVVIKMRQLENWLIADPANLARLHGRFRLPKSVVRVVKSGGADSIDATRVLKSAAIKKDYSKVEDALRILSRSDALEMGKHSRSFRKLLREAGHPQYAHQSKVAGKP
jgi:rhodanese-related sulfurtransferase